MKKFFIFILFFSCVSIAAQSSVRIESFSPTGVVKSPNQVAVRFSEQMVPMGDPRAGADIFSSNCKDWGTGRWVDSKNWVFDFSKTLEAGMECKFTLRPGLKSLAGNPVSSNSSYSFFTGGIQISYSSPWNGSTISEDQIFLFKLDGEVDVDSALKNIYLLTDNSSSRVEFNLVSGTKRKELVEANYWNQIEDKLLLVLQPKTKLADSSKVRLVWSKNIQSPTGVRNEKDQVLNFKVRPKFQVSFYCQRESANKHCIPLTDMEVRFSSPVPSKYFSSIKFKDKKGKERTIKLSESDKNSNTFDTLTLPGPFEEKEIYKLEISGEWKDDSGRSLSNASSFPMEIRTDAYPPLAKFASRFGVLESKATPILPVTIRNLEATVTGSIFKISPEEFQVPSLSKWMTLVNDHKYNVSVFNKQNVSPLPLQVPKIMQDGSMEVVGIPLIKPGFYVVEVKSGLLGKSLTGKSQDYHVSTAVLVTNLGIHFKWGRESSLVWVTDLSTGKPVPRADVSISDCKGNILAKGKTLGNGVLRVANIPDRSKITYCSWKTYENGLFITVKHESDVSFLHSSWNEGIENWRYNLPYPSFRDSEIVHTFLDRTLFRAGETVSMKHTIRKHSMKGFVSPDLKSIPAYIMIKHEGTETTWYKKINWSFPGSASNDWKIPKDANLGAYSIYLAESEDDKWGRQRLGEFRVEEFRLPILKASLSSSQMTWVDEESIPLTMQASYQAGGSALDLSVILRTKIEPGSFRPKGWDSYIFSSTPLKTGRSVSENYNSDNKGYDAKEFKLNREGIQTTKIAWKDRKEVSVLKAEMEFKDPNGEIQSVATRIQLLPSRQFVGIGADSSMMSKDGIKLKTVVVNSEGKSIKGADIEVFAFERQDFVHRKRLVGGFYAYDYYSEVNILGKVCEGKTDNKGYYICSPQKFSHTGDIVFEARSKDSQGGVSFASRSVWIAGKNDWWFSAGDTDRMDIIPDKDRYKEGDKARVKIEAPFPDYTALITVEREGVMRNYVREVNGKDPYVEIPIEKEDTPNVFVSVLALRGRVGSPKETALVDLAKPSYRLGIRGIKVGWDPYELNVDLKTDKKEYQIRSQAELKVKVTQSGKNISGGEVAIAVVDEALLELSSNNTKDLLDTMMGTRGIEVDSYSLQMQVVGKRHYGKKAVPTGGGGGNQPTRELLDTLLYWKPDLRLDNKGEAVVKIPIKDSLTSYRVIVVATQGTDFFGAGETKFSATQDLLVFSGLPPVVRTGDRFLQEWTLKNNSKSTMNLEISLTADGTNGKESFPGKSISLKSDESQKIVWDTVVGAKSGERTIHLVVKSGSKTLDSLKTTQKIEESIPVRITQGTVFQWDSGEKSISISQPSDSIPGRGSVNLGLSASILVSSQGIKDYMKSYPFTCIEQKFSKAIVSEDGNDKKSVISELPAYMDSDGLIKYFPNAEWGDEILTATILILANEADWKLPSTDVDKMVTGLNRFLDGTLVRQKRFSFNDSIMRKMTLLDAIGRYSSVSARLQDMDPEVANLPNSSLLHWISILQRQKNFSKGKAFLEKAETNLKGRLNFQGTEMVLRDGQGDLWWMMGSKDLDAARFISYSVDKQSYKEDMGRLALGFLSRMKEGRFSTTLANSFGYLALKKFSSRYEKDSVTGVTSVNLNQMKRDVDWSTIRDNKFTTSLPMNQTKEGNLTVNHKGSGKPWVFVSTESAIPLKKYWDNGIRIRKVIKPISQKSKGKWSVGDIVSVQLTWDLSSARTWVAIQDPVPSGSTILGGGLNRDPEFAGNGSYNDSGYWLSFQERGFSSYRAYYEYLPEGKYSLEYNFRINQEGKFSLPPTRAEAMYSPDIFGETPNEEWIVLP